MRDFLAGDLDQNNPSGLTLDELNKIKREGFIQYLGYQKTSLYLNHNNLFHLIVKVCPNR